MVDLPGAGTTYQFAAIAFDARGNQSARGAAGSVRPSTVATNRINGTVARSGSGATFTPAVWFTTINPGGQATVGVQGGGTAFSPPASFTLNGVPCTTV